MVPAPSESGCFPAAPADLPTKFLTGFTLSILGVLAIGGCVQMGLSVGEGDVLGAVRGLSYVALALAAGVFALARTPRAYRLEQDGAHGTILVVERRWSGAVRLALGRYQDVLGVRRVVFPWVPLLSGTRVFGLRGARIEESLAGFWSFGRDGRRALIFTGPGRPRTLVSPDDPQAMLAALARLDDAPRQASAAAVEGVTAVASFVGENPGLLDEVRFVLSDEDSLDACRSAARLVPRFTT